FGSLERAQRQLVHLIDYLGVRAGRRLQTSPRHRVGSFTIGVEVVEELACRDPRSEAIQASEAAGWRTWLRFSEQGDAEFLERLPGEGGQLRRRRSARVPLLRRVHIRPVEYVAGQIARPDVRLNRRWVLAVDGQRRLREQRRFVRGIIQPRAAHRRSWS